MLGWPWVILLWFKVLACRLVSQMAATCPADMQNRLQFVYMRKEKKKTGSMTQVDRDFFIQSFRNGQTTGRI